MCRLAGYRRSRKAGRQSYYDGQAVVGEIVRREKMSIGGLLTYYERRSTRSAIIS